MIVLEKNKIYYKHHDEVFEEISSKDIPRYLGDYLEISEGVTFERVFNIIIDNKELFNEIFAFNMGNYLIDHYIDEFNKPASPDNEWFKDVSYCEVYAVFEHMKFNDGTEDNSFYYGIHGKAIADEINFGFMGSKMNDYKHLPMKIDNHLDFVIDSGEKLHGKKAVTFEEKYKKVHSGDLPITLFNFFGAILSELTFMGTPEQRDSKFEEIEIQVEEINDGTAVMYPMEWDEDGEAYLVIDGKKKYFHSRDEEDSDDK